MSARAAERGRPGIDRPAPAGGVGRLAGDLDPATRPARGGAGPRRRSR